MTADDLRAIPEACDAAGNRVGWVPVPVATRDALADLIDAAQDVDANVDPAVTGNALRDALAALEADQ